MELKDIVSISGKPGLYKVIAHTGRGMIIESIDDKKTRTPVNASQQVALLEEITIYTDNDEDLTLKTVFEALEKQAAEEPVPSPKADQNEMRAYFEKIAPNYDRERVYASDLKKIFKWYEILSENNKES